MGSWCELSIDDFLIASSKSYVDDTMLSIFQERDRRVTTAAQGDPEDNPEYKYEYALSAQAMRERLDAMGFTVPRARCDYTVGLSNELRSYDEPVASDLLQEIERLQQRTYDHWRDAIGRLISQGFQTYHDEDRWSFDPDASDIRNDGEHGLGAFFSDLRFLVRGVLDACQAAEEIVLDYSALVYGEYYSQDEKLCTAARLRWSRDHPLFGPIVILTEGRSDARVLSAALEAMAPHLADLFSFLDFDGVKLEGSADALVKNLRAFAGARVSTRMLALFDNDTAGLAALSLISESELPPNFRAMSLPYGTLAAAYPTTGPQGRAVMDVNGLACSIELYLGREALTGAGGLSRVRWTGYNSKMGRYQGAVEDKSAIVDRFMSALRTCRSPTEARSRFPDLAGVVDMLAAAFSRP
jgi:hypothetical protein